jgi:hypothetical protein
MWKPRAGAYFRNAGVMRGASGSACVMIAEVLSGMRMVTRTDGPEDPRAKAALLTDERQLPDPPGVELQLLARRSIATGIVGAERPNPSSTTANR